MGSHSVICHPTEVTAQPSPQPGRLVLGFVLYKYRSTMQEIHVAGWKSICWITNNSTAGLWITAQTIMRTELYRTYGKGPRNRDRPWWDCPSTSQGTTMHRRRKEGPIDSQHRNSSRVDPAQQSCNEGPTIADTRRQRSQDGRPLGSVDDADCW